MYTYDEGWWKGAAESLWCRTWATLSAPGGLVYCRVDWLPFRTGGAGAPERKNPWRGLYHKNLPNVQKNKKKYPTSARSSVIDKTWPTNAGCAAAPVKFSRQNKIGELRCATRGQVGTGITQINREREHHRHKAQKGAVSCWWNARRKCHHGSHKEEAVYQQTAELTDVERSPPKYNHSLECMLRRSWSPCPILKRRPLTAGGLGAQELKPWVRSLNPL